MKNILYVMNVDWRWIKQRPHFIAEELSKNYNVKVIYQYRYNRKGLQYRDDERINALPIYVIPRGDRIKLLKKINLYIMRRAIKKQIKATNAEILYLTFPNQIDMIPLDYEGKIVYDCMDNHPAFICDIEQRKKVLEFEKKLIDKADLVLVSSKNLLQKLIERNKNVSKEKYIIIRNAYNGNIINNCNKKEVNIEKKFCYFGTISSWFNFEYIEKSLERFSNIRYELYGPIEGVSIPQNDRIVYKGTVEHSQLEDIAKEADCLIMPFIVNEIIEAVDPVKLYEYINFNKNILCCRYSEIERFSPFVYFYNSYTEFVNAIEEIISKKDIKYEDGKRISFLYNNSWKVRGEDISRLLSNLLDS